MATFLQETVGVPISEEQKMQMIQNLGYTDEKKGDEHSPEAKGRPQRASTSGGSGSTSASSAGAVKKSIGKTRELQRRHSGGSERGRRCLDGAMDMAEDCDDGVELMAEKPDARRHCVRHFAMCV